MRRIRYALTTSFVTAALVTATAGAPAHAALAPFSLSYTAAASTTVKKLNQKVDFPQTEFVATVALQDNPADSSISGPLNLPPATTAVRLGPLKLVTITLQTDHATPVEGTVSIVGSVWTVSAQQSFQVHITRISPLGLRGVNLVPPTCHTAATTATLVGTLDFAKVGQPGGPDNTVMSGSYAIPRFTGCGAVTPVLNGLVSGPNNPISVHLTL